MDPRGVLTEAFGRITELYDGVAEGLDDETLHHRPGGTGNPIGWLLWHLARVQDDHIADLADGSRRCGRSGRSGSGCPTAPTTSATATPASRSTPSGSPIPSCSSATTTRSPSRPRATCETVDERELEREVDQTLGPARHRRPAARQHHRRLPPAPRPGGVRQGPAGGDDDPLALRRPARPALHRRPPRAAADGRVDRRSSGGAGSTGPRRTSCSARCGTAPRSSATG